MKELIQTQRTNFDNLSVALATGNLGLGNVAAKGLELAARVSTKLIAPFMVDHNPSRRALFATAAGTALALSGLPATIARIDGTFLTPKEAKAQEFWPSWQPTQPGVPNCRDAEVSRHGFTSLFMKSTPDEIDVYLGGPTSYQDRRGISFDFEGRRNDEANGSAVIVYRGTVNGENDDVCTPGGIELKVFEEGGWRGKTRYPSGARTFVDAKGRLIADLNHSMRAPEIGNNVKRLDYALIDGQTGDIIEIGQILVDNSLSLTYSQPAPEHIVSTASAQPSQPTGGEQPTQPGFVGEGQPAQTPAAPQGGTQPGFVDGGATQPAGQPTTSALPCKPHYNPSIEVCTPGRKVVAVGDSESLIDGRWVPNYDNNGNTGSVTITDKSVRFPFGGDVVDPQGDPEGIATGIADGMRNVSGCASRCTEGVTIYRR